MIKSKILALIATITAAGFIVTPVLEKEAEQYKEQFQNEFKQSYSVIEPYADKVPAISTSIIGEFKSSVETIRQYSGLDFTEFAAEICDLLELASDYTGNLKDFKNTNFDAILSK